jgi:hypothetical protein
MTTWMEVKPEIFENLVVGKRYRFDGRIGRVLAKQMPDTKNRARIVGGFPMVKVSF